MSATPGSGHSTDDISNGLVSSQNMQTLAERATSNYQHETSTDNHSSIGCIWEKKAADVEGLATHIRRFRRLRMGQSPRAKLTCGRCNDAQCVRCVSSDVI